MYYSSVPINNSNITSTDVQILAFNITAGIGNYTHNLIAPVFDTSVDYYYAVTCIDNIGIESSVVENFFTGGKAKGVAVNYIPGFLFEAD